MRVEILDVLQPHLPGEPLSGHLTEAVLGVVGGVKERPWRPRGPDGVASPLSARRSDDAIYLIRRDSGVFHGILGGDDRKRSKGPVHAHAVPAPVRWRVTSPHERHFPPVLPCPQWLPVSLPTGQSGHCPHLPLCCLTELELRGSSRHRRTTAPCRSPQTVPGAGKVAPLDSPSSVPC